MRPRPLFIPNALIYKALSGASIDSTYNAKAKRSPLTHGKPVQIAFHCIGLSSEAGHGVKRVKNSAAFDESVVYIKISLGVYEVAAK